MRGPYIYSQRIFELEKIEIVLEKQGKHLF